MPTVRKLDGSEPQSYAVRNLREVGGRGRIVAEFDLVFPGTIRLLECVLVVDETGEPAFVAPPSVKAAFDGAYARLVKFNWKFSTELLDVVLAELDRRRRQHERRATRARAL